MNTTTFSRRGLLLGAAGLGAAAVVGASGLRPPRASAADLRIYSTAEWGAAAPTWTPDKLWKRPSTIVVHHMDTPNTTDFSQDAAFRIARSVQSWHMDQDWGDSGQHFSVSRGGHILEGRHGSLAAAQDGSYFIEGIHAKGANLETIGIENEGRYVSALPPADQWAALVQLIVWLCRQYGLTQDTIVGHRDCSSTACPGDAFYGALDALRADVAAGLAGDGGSPTPPPTPEPEPTNPLPWPLTQSGAAGNAVWAVQRLLQHRGHDLAVDGQFGPNTEQAVRDFQSGAGLAVDGIVGQNTWSALIVLLRSGAAGAAVTGLQELLNRSGAALTVDGAFGANTQQAVITFQKQQHYATDGIVGPITWKGLVTA